MIKVRQEVEAPQPPPPSPGVKQLEIHSLWIKKTRRAGPLREEAGPCPDHMFLFPKLGDLPDHARAEEAP